MLKYSDKMHIISKITGTSVIYYGDEIGMTGYLDEFSWEDTKDPYAKRYCDNSNDCYTKKSRDPMRTPMQVRHTFLCNI